MVFFSLPQALFITRVLLADRWRRHYYKSYTQPLRLHQKLIPNQKLKHTRWKQQQIEVNLSRRQLLQMPRIRSEFPLNAQIDSNGRRQNAINYRSDDFPFRFRGTLLFSHILSGDYEVKIDRLICTFIKKVTKTHTAPCKNQYSVSKLHILFILRITRFERRIQGSHNAFSVKTNTFQSNSCDALSSPNANRQIDSIMNFMLDSRMGHISSKYD